ncbi:hypothetical protein K435DRAFT_706713 [Dendrothele bispora CBS 962.96]|uniref:Uncharacterized protein n=1 Tax=Dendrothele bispora (strain CBS 962.96) TaxID=1314807 RepID=A0A4V4HAI9_DENBC|nr:hypothetical protein K435DRAFT_706713 [Dendrothele bispora CBS 962.96]
MPKSIEKLVTKRVQNFIWAEKEKNPVNKELVYSPIEIGGWKVLNIEARNRAIDIIWVKSYLKFGNDCPLWAKVADAILAHYTPKSEDGVDKRCRINPILQSWKTSPPKHAKTAAANDLQCLIKTIKTFNIRQEGLAFSREQQRQMPIWYHKHADPAIRKLNRSTASECLKTKHKIFTVGQAERLAEGLNEETQ